MEKIFEPGLKEQIEVLKKELDLERENAQVDRLAAVKEIKNLKWIKDHDYIFLVDENKKLHEEVRKLKEETRLHEARKAGL